MPGVGLVTEACVFSPTGLRRHIDGTAVACATLHSLR